MRNGLLLIAFGVLNLFYTNAQSPNIILIIADDLGVDALNGYHIGDVNPTTPHLDSIRNSGVTFSNAWSSPVCTPTRAGIMSGMYGSKTGVKTAPGNLDLSFTSLLKAVKETNPLYSSAVTGKWHISHPLNEMHPFQHEADHYMVVMSGGVLGYNNWDKTENNTTVNSTDYVTSYFTDDAINWINNQNNPWLMWLAHVAPHTPLHVPPAYMHSQPSTNSQLKKYMAMIESLDYEVGRILDAFTPTERLNTVVIFIGDNGTPNNVLQEYPTDHGKELLYQGGIHVPMFVSGSGVTRIGEVEPAMVNVIDIYATVLELAGANLDGGIHNSLSFKHLLTGSNSPKRQYNLSELDTNQASINTQGYAIRDNVYKLITYVNGDQEMFNLILDTLETNNLLLGVLSNEEANLKVELENEANQRRTAWSCHDDIKNGNETGIDCGGTYCSPCLNSISLDYLDSKIDIFPNPTEEMLTIHTNHLKSIELYNSFGQLVLNSKKVNGKSIIVNVSNLKPAIYYIKINVKNGNALRKICIK